MGDESILVNVPGPSHTLTPIMSTPHYRIDLDNIDSELAAGFDGSLSGLGVEIGSVAYNMSEALLALPVFKQEQAITNRSFQIVLGAATSPASKLHDETLTYLNQGQTYEIKLKKLGDISDFQGKLLKSIIKVTFHERRHLYQEAEQWDVWRQQHAGVNAIDVDIPLSYGIHDVVRGSSCKTHQVEFMWDPTKEAGVFVMLNCISTEFTAKKHGGEKGIPFRIQVDTYFDDSEDGLGGKPSRDNHLHSACCQVRVFKPKGADRKHKQEKEKWDKKSQVDQAKYQPSYDCTIMMELSPEQALLEQQGGGGGGASGSTSAIPCGARESPTGGAGYVSNGSISSDSGYLNTSQLQHWTNNGYQTNHSGNTSPTPAGSTSQSSHGQVSHSAQSPVHGAQWHSTPVHTAAPGHSSPAVGTQPRNSAPSVDVVRRACKSEPSPSKESLCGGEDDNKEEAGFYKRRRTEHGFTTHKGHRVLPTDADPQQVSSWLKRENFSKYVKVFQHFSGADLMRLSKDDLVQICGLSDGIRLNNALQYKPIRPRLTLYVHQDKQEVYHAVYLDIPCLSQLVSRLAPLVDLTHDSVGNVYVTGPCGIIVLVTDSVVANFEDSKRFTVERVQIEEGKESYKIILHAEDVH